MPLTSVSADNGSLAIAWSFSASVEAVWNGLTDAGLLSQWLGRPIECDVRTGGTVAVDHGEGYRSRSVITEMARPQKLAMTWEFPEEPVSRIAIRLRTVDAGTLLEFAHHDLGTLVDSYGPGWITHLTYLEAAVAGAALPNAQFWPLHSTLETLYAAHLEQKRITA
ncbi:SRPBCC domain-containing protein [Arthrobacter zhaoxinii]|uniref:SRPBCC domain-containing protein n=1 Tax=Arthrobacter zhaoxinii TaxID=2964616 RepID=A0ABY5YTG4_9MICC|nr:SRPBCC domain-containing protein [Arthrobacter zhaoxinii]UWX98409.1 SRPBCC domain-containing protein [Arthrobacter zhaoxinii]